MPFGTLKSCELSHSRGNRARSYLTLLVFVYISLHLPKMRTICHLTVLNSLSVRCKMEGLYSRLVSSETHEGFLGIRNIWEKD